MTCGDPVCPTHGALEPCPWCRANLPAVLNRHTPVDTTRRQEDNHIPMPEQDTPEFPHEGSACSRGNDSSVVRMVDRTHDNTQWSVEQMLEDAIGTVRKQPQLKKAVVMYLNDETGYEVGYAMCNLSSSEVLALLEVMKQMQLQLMGYAADPDDVIG